MKERGCGCASRFLATLSRCHERAQTERRAGKQRDRETDEEQTEIYKERGRKRGLGRVSSRSFLWLALSRPCRCST
eukprot:4943360-Pleurochrysis_carterae.AAC.1